MLASLITRPLRIATRSAQITLHGAHEAVELAEGLLGLVAGRLIGHNGHNGHNGDYGHEAAEGARRSPEPEAWRGPAASSTSAPADRAAPAARPTATPGATETTTTPTSPATAAPTEPAAAPSPSPRETRPPAPGTPGTAEAAAAEPPAPEPRHVDAEVELVEEVAEPGAEEGAGAQLRIAEPWDGYGSMKAADVVDRLATATPEELAAVELYEVSGRNRKSVVAAAQRALKRASPPR
ncbi:MAG TPA: hypothetical protein VFN87_10265 [Solirubrobacteraceae bacterium]|nr:hypothetical protein [Solirubrobacteraceae bacterium]